MNINIVRLNANNTVSSLVDTLNTKLKNFNVILKENVNGSPVTLFFIESGGTEALFLPYLNKYSSPYYLFV